MNEQTHKSPLTLTLTGTMTAITEFSTHLPNGPSKDEICRFGPDVRQRILGFNGASDKDKISFLPRMPRRTQEGWTYVPFVTAPSIRSALRHAAVDEIYRRADTGARGDGPLTIDEFYLLASGGVVETEKKHFTRAIGNGVNLERPDHLRALRAENPLLSLFGAMSTNLAGRLATGPAVATENVCTSILFGVRADDLRRASDHNAERFSAKQIEEWTKTLAETQDSSKAKQGIKAQITKINKEIKKPDKDSAEVASLKEQRAKLDEDQKAAKDQGNISQLQLLPGYEAVPAGATFANRMSLHRVSPAEVGLFFAALRILAADFRLGAHRSQDGGQFEAHYDLSINGRKVGTLNLHDGVLDCSPEDLTMEFDATWEAFDLNTLLASTAKVA